MKYDLQSALSNLNKAREVFNIKVEMILNNIELVTNSIINDLAAFRTKYSVPAKIGKTFNTQSTSIANKIKNNGLDTTSWNPPSSQTARFKALEKAKASNWKDGFLMVEDGDLKYPFINTAGKAMLSGLYAGKARAASNGESKVVEIIDSVILKLDLKK